jgi:adenylate cyclase
MDYVEKVREMSQENMGEEKVADLWRRYLTTGEFEQQRRQRNLFRILPGTPRCKNCYAPFKGAGSLVVKLIYGKEPSSLNPRLCNICDIFAKEYQGGAEIELSLLFADVRGSTQLSESMSPREFSQLINRFYNTATSVMVNSDALIDKIIGDQVAGMYVPGFAGEAHAFTAIEAAREILLETGHAHEEGPWIPLGVGVHTGVAFVGAVGSKDGASDITVLGEAPNIAARLCSSADVGEILISADAREAAGVDADELDTRSLELKGISRPFEVYALSPTTDIDL